MANDKTARKSESKKPKGSGEKIARLESLDVFRAIMLLLILFLYDASTLKSAPSWIFDMVKGQDKFGLIDLVLPGFLFAMGMAVPYALETRRQKGDPLWSVSLHVALRTVALLVMGVFLVNYEGMGKSSLPAEWLGIGLVISFFLIWNDYEKAKGYLIYGLRAIGIAGLVWFCYQYKAKGGGGFNFKSWGLLGVLGWSYLLCAVVILFTRLNLLLSLIAAALAIALATLPNTGLIKQFHLHQWAYLVPGGGIHAAFALVGAMAGVLVHRFGEKASFNKTLLPMLLGLAVAALLAAYWARHQWIISRTAATPTWFFFCCAVFFLLFTLIYWTVEVAGKGKWFKFLHPAAVASLTCYMIPYIWVNVQALTKWGYPKMLNEGWPGLLRSLVVSLACIGVGWILIKVKVRLKI
ncbi:MAG: hypothetical protein ACOX2U_09370 [Limisphaerales bacterium]|jgi:heparan-alpha-glucosaminide N-acetyltransferase|nr:DUF5009 domain-containing protein [Verrucomicrobiota bacterium]